MIRGFSAAVTCVLFGPDDTAPLLRAAVARKTEHPRHDMTILELTEPPAIDVTPIPVDRGSLSDADVGMTVEQAGYGRTSPRGRADGRLFVAELLDGFEREGEVLVVNGLGVHGVCFGTREGRVLGRDCGRCGESCRLVSDIHGYACVVTDCGGVTDEGQCVGDVAQWCNESRELASRDCASEGLRCGWVGAGAGYYCQ